MTNSKVLFNQLVNKIRLDESKDEIDTIIYALMESQFGLTMTDVLTEKGLVTIDWPMLEKRIQRINRHEPIQYIIGEAGFYGRKFKVNPSVLIPRPETELIIREAIGAQHLPRGQWGPILDIGTGSGCVAITLAKELPHRKIVATDVSADALMTAAENAKLNDADVEFFQHNILTGDLPLTGIELMVSNPPYVTGAEKNTMKKNVLEYEPSLALFVPDDDPFIFYKAIIQKGRIILRAGGSAVVEINEKYGTEVAALFHKEYDQVRIIKDLAGKDRVVSARVRS